MGCQCIARTYSVCDTNFFSFLVPPNQKYIGIKSVRKCLGSWFKCFCRYNVGFVSVGSWGPFSLFTAPLALYTEGVTFQKSLKTVM